jgi:outer membrane protein insertion porin family
VIAFGRWWRIALMRGRITGAIVLALLLNLVGFASWQRVAAAAPADSLIVVTGNRHLDAAIIRSHFRAGADGRLDDAALDAALKSLYGTGLFQDVKIARDGDRLLVTVAENPTIRKLAFEGNRKVKDDDLKLAVQSKENGPLARAIVHGDVEHIIELYRQRGYFEVRVEPKTIAVKDGRVDLIFETTEGAKLAVRQILFVGNDAYSPSKLKGVIKTGETNFLSFLFDNDAYDADRIENDRDLLRRFYLAHGYADVRVRAAASYEAGKKGVLVTFTIDQGPRYRLERVDIESNLKSIDVAALRPYLRLHAGDVYDADAIDKTSEDIAIALAKGGKPFVSVIARGERVPPSAGGKTGVINLVYTVDEGKRLYVERIEIHGNSKTRDEVIRREFDFVEGDAYNRALIERDERRLKRLGYFKTVKIGTEPGSAPDRVVLDVTVEEQQTGNFSIMGGYSAATGATLEVGVNDRDVLGTGDLAKASFSVGQYAWGFDLGFTDPYALGPRLSLGGDLFGNETLANSYQSFNSTVYGARISTGMPLNDQIGVTWTYSIYNQGLSLDPAVGTASLPIQLAAAAGPMWVSSIGTSVTYSTLDDPKNPTDGIRAQTNNEFAGLGGAAKFARTTEDVRYYREIVGDVVGMVRAQGGYVTPWGGQQLPLLDGFFGGPQLVRGFAPNGYGPRDITPGTTQDNVGGNIYWTTSAELQAPVPLVPPDAQLKVALFSDAGSLWATPASGISALSSLSPAQQIANSQAIRASVGASLIWGSPFGPIRVDYAYPVAKQSYDVTQRLNFTAGGF